MCTVPGTPRQISMPPPISIMPGSTPPGSAMPSAPQLPPPMRPQPPRPLYPVRPTTSLAAIQREQQEQMLRQQAILQQQRQAGAHLAPPVPRRGPLGPMPGPRFPHRPQMGHMPGELQSQGRSVGKALCSSNTVVQPSGVLRRSRSFCNVMITWDPGPYHAWHAVTMFLAAVLHLLLWADTFNLLKKNGAHAQTCIIPNGSICLL